MRPPVFKLYGRASPEEDLRYHSKHTSYKDAVTTAAEEFSHGNFYIETPSNYKFNAVEMKPKRSRKTILLQNL